ncbi:metallophosphoesterase [Streptomyces sp. Go40/10]|uniref:metallophosphoesterase family protein n=1 Tax=Streptomyces sp. Go40/10 TaxID=2825844 RepID=UPI001E30EF70|nr:metallophosphoesterase [Streptomyces sp. Go40/10]UFR04335.1 metallophosphoesterase [Streptomyces sp. Go40/10]
MSAKYWKAALAMASVLAATVPTAETATATAAAAATTTAAATATAATTATAAAAAAATTTATAATAAPAAAVSGRTAPDRAGPRPPGPTPPPGGGGGEAWSWTQLTGQGTRIRYVSTDTSHSCPTVRYTYGGVRAGHQLQTVSTPSGTKFPTTVCEVGVPLTASDAVLDASTVHAAAVHPGNLRLPLPEWTATTRPTRIAVVGDTGCSVPGSGPVQDCADHQNGWPFARIATSIVGRTRPDLVIHVGDFLYREDPGRENDKPANPGCTTSADAAGWACVVADFFRPAETLLAAAPLALTRGNHEDCNTAHTGGAGGAFYRYLADQLRSDGKCVDYPDPVVIDAGALGLVALDSAFADPKDSGSTAGQSIYTRQFETVNQAARHNPARDYFLFTHKPLWAVRSTATTPPTWWTHVLAGAVAGTNLGRLADNVRLVLSGHIHLYQMIDFNTRRPPQLTVGSSGGTLEHGPDDSKAVGTPIGVPPQPVHQSVTQEQAGTGGLGVFGFADLRYGGGAWSVAFRNRNGDVRGRTCTLSGSLTQKSFSC